MTILLFVIGLLLLIFGAEALVRGASRLAGILGLSSLVIGLTVVAFGTSAPELAVSILAGLNNQASIAVGNVVGSNILNILLILGLSALITPLLVSRQLIRFDVPVMIAASLFALLISLDGKINRFDGIILIFGLMAYLWYSILQARKESAEMHEKPAKETVIERKTKSTWIKNIGLIIGGLALLVLGSRLLVNSAVGFAQYLGVSELVIGLTIVALGTSLPEVVTSIVAAIRGERDIAVGNVVGSNIFNILVVLGFSSLIAPSGLEISAAIRSFDLPAMILVAFASLPIFVTGLVISRWEGALLLGYYVAYTLYLILAATDHQAVSWFSPFMLYFAIPVTMTIIVMFALREIRVYKKRHSIIQH